MTTTQNPTGPHCEQCGSTDPEDLNEGDQGYSACCNECICWGGHDTVKMVGDDGKVLVRGCCYGVAERKYRAEHGTDLPDCEVTR